MTITDSFSPYQDRLSDSYNTVDILIIIIPNSDSDKQAITSAHLINIEKKNDPMSCKISGIKSRN